MNSKTNTATWNRRIFSRLSNFIIPLTKATPSGILVCTEDIILRQDTTTSIKIRIYNKAKNEELRQPIFIFIHGGGFVINRMASKGYDDFCREVALQTNMIVISIDYRLAPENPFPAAVADVYYVLDWCSRASGIHTIKLGCKLWRNTAMSVHVFVFDI